MTFGKQVHLQTVLDHELGARAEKRTRELGLSASAYLRRLVDEDTRTTTSAPESNRVEDKARWAEGEVRGSSDPTLLGITGEVQERIFTLNKAARILGYDLGCALGSAYDGEDREDLKLTVSDVRELLSRGYTVPGLDDDALWKLMNLPAFRAGLHTSFDYGVRISHEGQFIQTEETK